MATGFYSHADCMLHDMGQWHPECPARLQAIEDQLIASRIDALIEREPAPLADDAALLRVHTQAHVDYLRSLAPNEGYAAIDPDTSMNPHTLQAALRAARADVQLLRASFLSVQRHGEPGVEHGQRAARRAHDGHGNARGRRSDVAAASA